ncbi:hypothetical protein [Leptothoe spongobia]|uniref:Uncharacterized protein n=1 Tax=Leptothoe spongobia TAU-MAC 1115 TaxID=1967444 RepID=A0A947DF05_9CYAN|nr:hypothetical protein [Leptothoe spongobia]MBT9315710.1 hypothetical protein [Leptothoe spongobia TAU-MAC 1115]
MSLKEYKQMRRVGKRLSEKIPEQYGLETELPRMIRVMGVGQGKRLVLENEEEVNFLIDFYLHEILSNGQTMLERYRSDHTHLKSEEISYLDAAKASYTSLFKISSVHPKQNCLTVNDLLNTSDHQPLSVININLSKTAKPGYVVFSRLLPYKQFNAFSGMFAVFDEGSDRALLKRYKVMKKRIKSDRESVQRFVACFKINRVIGIPIFTR